eukprot:9481337-Alexandrium_andersonii.AAC.1
MAPRVGPLNEAERTESLAVATERDLEDTTTTTQNVNNHGIGFRLRADWPLEESRNRKTEPVGVQ